MAELDVEALKQSTKDIDNPTIGMDSHRSAVASFIAQRHALIAALEDRDYMTEKIHALSVSLSEVREDRDRLRAAAQEWERCRKERESLPIPFGVTPADIPEMARMTEEAHRANEMLRAALEGHDG